MSSKPLDIPDAPAPAPTSVAPTNVRRSPRLATKPAKNYAPERELPDELLKERTKAMFDTLLTEKVDKAYICSHMIYLSCKKCFLKMFADLAEEDEERVAAETFIRELPTSAGDYPLYNTLADAHKRARRDTYETPLRCKKELIDTSFTELVETIKEFDELYIKLVRMHTKLENLAKPVIEALKQEPLARRRTCWSVPTIKASLNNYLIKSCFPLPTNHADKVKCEKHRKLFKKILNGRFVTPAIR